MRRTGEAFSIAIFDLDHFKVINDTFGHAGGDAVLKHFCALVEATRRASDLFARYGGEEFVLLMPSTACVDQAAVGVDRIRATTMDADWSPALRVGQHRVTVSAGVATCRPDESVEELLARADAAMYVAKSQGRNRVTVAR